MTVIDSKTKHWLAREFGGDVRFDEPMAEHTSFRVGGPADAYIAPDTEEKLLNLIEQAVLKRIPYMVVGNGTNLLVKDRGIRGLVIILKKCLSTIARFEINADHVLVAAAAGAKMQALCRFALKQGLKGMNFAIGIPGTVGGGIMMNAGTSFGDVAHVLKSVKVLQPPRNVFVISRENMGFGYRHLAWTDTHQGLTENRPIILEGVFKLHSADPIVLEKEAKALMEERGEKQPIAHPSAGCFFKNPKTGKTAGELLDLAGLKSTRIGDAAISPLHANYIVNMGRASAAEVMALMELAQERVFRKFNIQLKPEVKIVGE
jgi:UDP-N-acetylmuramate dehydrogenase